MQQALGFFSITVLLMVLGSVEVGWWPLTFIAVLPLVYLLLSPINTNKRGWFFLYFAFLFWYHYVWILSVVSFAWLGEVSFWIPWIVIAIYLLIGAVFGCLGIVLVWVYERFLGDHKQLLPITLPLAWVIVELVASFFLFSHPLMSLGFQLVPAPVAFLWPIYIVGVSGLTFVIVALNTLLVLALNYPGRYRFRTIGALVVFLVVGYVLPQETEASAQALQVHLIKPPRGYVGASETMSLLDRVAAVSAPRSLILLPEETYGIRPQEEREQLAYVASHIPSDATLLMGVARDDPAGRDNLGYLVNRAGSQEIIGKVNPVVFGERLPFADAWPADIAQAVSVRVRPWNGASILNYRGVHLGVAFCSELLETRRVQQVVQEGSDLLITLANLEDIPHPFLFRDFTWLTKLRALEFGQTSIYASNQGPLAIFSAQGRALGIVQAADTQDLSAAVPLTKTHRLRSSITDEMLLLGSLCLFFVLVYATKRTRRGGERAADHLV